MATLTSERERWRPHSVTETAWTRQPESYGSLLELDPDLGTLLGGERANAAQRDLQVPLRELGRGEFDPAALLAPRAGNVGVLVISGVAIREVDIDRTPSAELLGTGDLIRASLPDPGVACSIRWHALTPMVISPLGVTVANALCRYPEVLLALIDRTDGRAQRLAITQAISQLTGVEHRIEALLRHLAERWGKVRPDGLLLPLHLSHRMLGHLIGARRPTVSTAVALLSAQGRVTRLADGTWLLRNSPIGRRPAERSPLAVPNLL